MKTHFSSRNSLDVNLQYKEPLGQIVWWITNVDKLMFVEFFFIFFLFFNFVSSSIYSPSMFSIKENQYLSFFKSLCCRFITTGDHNRKDSFWVSGLISSKGGILFHVVSKIKLDVIYSGQPTQVPVIETKIPDVNDLGIVYNIP